MKINFTSQLENLIVEYDAPKVEIIEVEVEKGFANSDTESYNRRDYSWDE